MSCIYYSLLPLNNTGHMLIIQYYVFLKQVTYFNTSTHIYKQIFVFLNGDRNWKKCQRVHLISSPPTQSHKLTPTLIITYICHLLYHGGVIGVKLYFSRVFPHKMSTLRPQKLIMPVWAPGTTSCRTGCTRNDPGTWTWTELIYICSDRCNYISYKLVNNIIF